MKTLACVAVALLVVMSYGVVSAADSSEVPQDARQLAYQIWFPIVPEIPTASWSNILIVSNFNNFAINARCFFTTFSSEQTIKTYDLNFYEKKIITLNQAGFGGDLYDVFCESNNVFGAAVLFLEGGKISTAWPPIYWGF